ncbi:MAG: transcription antitermination factor NusB [Clostridia bacterium]|nr:transcription antitermination factor NusB [Clostridia bacterium]
MAQSENNEKKPLSRREERQQALDLVFERLFRDDSAEEVFEDAVNARGEEISDYARNVVKGVEEHIDEIDRIIEENLKGWKKNRISKISLTILRIAVYEMLYVKDVPVSVSINEAVELAKNYATAADGSFVNGVLGSAAKKLEKSGEN